MLDNARCRATTRDYSCLPDRVPLLCYEAACQAACHPSLWWRDDTALHFLSHSPAESYAGSPLTHEACALPGALHFQLLSMFPNSFKCKDGDLRLIKVSKLGLV